jgi:tetratricopeptide (TPR) repeat protein
MLHITSISYWVKWRYHITFVVSIVLYLPTITFDYTLDDAIVVYDNDFTKKGTNGIVDLLRYDTFRGFFKVEGKEKLVSGGRYRPLTPILFGIEYQITNGKPWLSHLMNVLFYGILALIILRLLTFLFRKIPDGDILALLATLIFICHPIHVEVVANIKGRDEILCLLFGCLAIWTHLKGQWLAPAIFIFLGLMSKEMAITILPLAVMIWLWDKRVTLFSGIIKAWPLVLGTVAYLGIRFSVLGWPDGGQPILEMMNNPFIKLIDGQYQHFTWSERSATIIFSLGEYLRLLFWPYPLTHDYYPRQIGVMSWTNVSVLISTLIYLVLLALSIIKRKSKLPFFLGIGFYLISLVLISNIFFPIGTHIGERFLFMASLGFAVAIASFWSVFELKNEIKALIILTILVFWCGLTLSRSQVWKNDQTLFLTDVKTSSNSAKANNAAGGVIIDKCLSSPSQDCPESEIRQAISYLDKAIAIHPNYKNAHLIRGNAFMLLKNHEAAIESYLHALRIDPNYNIASQNLVIAYNEAARFYGEDQGNTERALSFLGEAFSREAFNLETLRLAGIAHGIRGEFEQAIGYFKRILDIDPANSDALKNLGISYIQMGDEEQGKLYLERAQQLDEK